MSLLSPDDQLAQLQGRISELETRLNRIKGLADVSDLPAIKVAPAPPPTPVAPVAPAPLPKPVASPPPVMATPVAPPVVSVPSTPPAVTPVPSTPVPPAVAAPPPAPPVFVSPELQSSFNPPRPKEQEQGPPVAPDYEQFKAKIYEKQIPQPSARVPEPPQVEPQRSLLDWENLIGGRLALWVGVLCLFLSLASLLVYVGKTLPPPPPSARVAMGFLGSLALFTGAFAAHKRSQRWFGDGLIGAALAVGYLSVWGGGPHFGLWPFSVSVAGFGLYAALGVGLSARRDSQPLLLLAATGGFLTPVLVRHNNAEGLALTFLSYLLVLNAGIIAVCVAKKWRETIYGAFTATALLVWVWALEANVGTMRPMLWVFASLGWMLFAGASCFRAFKWREETEAEDSALLFTATGAYVATSQWLLAPLLEGFPGAFSLGMTLVFAALWWMTGRRLPSNVALRANFLALGCVVGALFVPLQFGQSGLVWGWMAQSFAVSFVGRRSGMRLLEKSGRVLWGMAMVALAAQATLSFAAGTVPFDAFSLQLAFGLAATALLLLDVFNDEQMAPVYGAFLAWGGAAWIGRVAWLILPRFSALVPAHRVEAAVLLGASGIALWSLMMWRAGWWRKHAELRFNAYLELGIALCAIMGVGLFGEAPLVGLRLLGFAIGAGAIGFVGHWYARYEEGEESVVGEMTPLCVASWVVVGLTIEIAAWGNGGHFGAPPAGATAWFALCAAWGVFASLAGAVSLWKSWPKLWAMAEALFAVSLGVLLWQSLLLPHPLTPLWNARLGAFVVVWLVALLARQVDSGSEEQRGQWWLGAILLLPLWASTQELWNGVAVHHAYFGPEWQRFASLGVSLLWSAYAMGCLIAGVAKRNQSMRVGALALGALTVCKVFLLDLAFLDGGLRVFSLGGLGIALMFISWLYSRLGRGQNDVRA